MDEQKSDDVSITPHTSILRRATPRPFRLTTEGAGWRTTYVRNIARTSTANAREQRMLIQGLSFEGWVALIEDIHSNSPSDESKERS